MAAVILSSEFCWLWCRSSAFCLWCRFSSLANCLPSGTSLRRKFRGLSPVFKHRKVRILNHWYKQLQQLQSNSKQIRRYVPERCERPLLQCWAVGVRYFSAAVGIRQSSDFNLSWTAASRKSSTCLASRESSCTYTHKHWMWTERWKKCSQKDFKKAMLSNNLKTNISNKYIFERMFRTKFKQKKT